MQWPIIAIVVGVQDIDNGKEDVEDRDCVLPFAAVVYVYISNLKISPDIPSETHSNCNVYYVPLLLYGPVLKPDRIQN